MEYLIISGIIVILRTLIKEIGKSQRISQLKKIDKSKIESIGNYEKKSKNYEYQGSLNKKATDIKNLCN